MYPANMSINVTQPIKPITKLTPCSSLGNLLSCKGYTAWGKPQTGEQP